MRFKYKTTNIGSDKIPLLDVIITNPENGKKVGYTALLDSGAFMNVFHSDIAKILEIDLDNIKNNIKFGGVGTSSSQLTGKPYVVNIMVSQKGKAHEFDSVVLFSDNINPNGEPLLGRQGFIDQFSKVELVLSKNVFYLYN
jgi:hypothetical protein